MESKVRDKKGRFIKGIKYQLGYRHTDKTKEKIKIARAKQGSNVWNKGKNISGNSGKKHTEKWKRKMRSIFYGNPRVDLRGDKSPNWKGGVTPLMLQIRNCFKYRQWRSDCFERDDFTCLLCGLRGGILNVDHYPDSFSNIFWRNKIKTYEQSLGCEEFWNINNGRTLCKKCHKLYGENIGNTKK